MSKQFDWKYGRSWEKFPIVPGQKWVDQFGSTLSVADITKHIPDFMLVADLVYCDPPWNLGNVNGFITKNGGQDHLSSFEDFYKHLFNGIQLMSPKVCYLEIGKQYVETFRNQLQAYYPFVQIWPITYYKKHLSYLLRGGEFPSNHSFTGLDDSITPMKAIETEKCTIVGDLCTGRGLTAISAVKAKKVFVGTELNPRRMAVTIEKMTKAGSKFIIE